MAVEPLEAPDNPLVAEPWDPASLGDGMLVDARVGVDGEGTAKREEEGEAEDGA